jgi:hypothetical protein
MHTSTRLLIHRFVVEGEPVVADVVVRQKFVEETLKRLLP